KGKRPCSSLLFFPDNSDLKWEVSKTLNLGLDFSLFNERISGSVEVYKKNTDDMISYVNVPVGTNLSNYIYANVGSMENSGLEVTLNTKPVINKDLVWNLGVNFSYNKTEITKLTARDDPDYLGIPVGTISGGVGNTIQYHSVGYAPNSFFVFQQVYDADGNPIEGLYVDRSGEGGSVISSLDNKYHYKNPTPDVTIGINSSLRYKNWDASLSGRLYLGNYNYNNVYSDRALYSSIYNQSGFLNNVPTALYDTKFYNTQYFSDYYIENASFFRMDNISVGYNFMKLFGANLDGRVSFTCQNVFVITNYSGLDPEVTGGIDNNIYPKARTFVLGLNLNL
ncbi:MAG: TonB-dependent receptor, partial [Sphingobacteriia bacterium]|nr:TonB-dependent receptor [Sphingobacteriia bacterium]